MIDYHNYIHVNPSVLTGKPVIKNTRISVELILEKLASGESIEQILEAHKMLTRESILAALAYATDVMKSEIIYPIAS